MRFTAPELLEGRIAPATLVNPTTVTFIDVDGDLVTVKTTAGIFTKEMFQFLGSNFDDAGPQQLSLLDLSGTTGFLDASISITAKKVGSGDGFVNVGALIADVDLNTVTVDGDLGRVVVGGDSDGSDKALSHLKVGSLGAEVADSQGLDLDLVSVINGDLARLTTSGNLIGRLEVLGHLESARIGGDIRGYQTVAGAGVIFAQSIGAVNVLGDINGSTSGGANSVGIRAETSIAKITVAGALRGGGGAGSAFISAGETLGTLSIAKGISGANTGTATISVGGSVDSIIIGADNDGGALKGNGPGSAVISTGALGKLVVKGDIRGGATGSARIEVDGALGSAKVSGKLIGGDSGSAIISAAGDIGKITVAGLQGAGEGTARIFSGGDIGTVSVLGNVSGSASGSAVIEATSTISKIKITGDLYGGGNNSGRISAGKIGSVQVYGSLSGSSQGGGSIVGGEIGRVTIKGHVSGGDLGSASIISEGSIASIFVGDYVTGSFGSGRIEAGGDIGKVRIMNNLGVGGSDSASIYAAGNIKYVRVGGSLIGGGENSATIIADGTIGKVAIGGNLQGSAPGSASIISHAAPSESSPLAIGRVSVAGYITGGASDTAVIGASSGSIGVVSVGGTIQGGGGGSASIHAQGSIKSLTIKGTVNPGALDSAQIRAGADIAKISLGGDFKGSIHAGSLGRVTIGSLKAPASLLGNGPGTGMIAALGNISSIVVYGDVQGDSSGSGRIGAGGDVNSITVSGRLTGNGPGSGVIAVDGNVGKIAVGELLGNAGGASGGSNVAFIGVAGTINTLRVTSIAGASNYGVDAIEHNASVSAGRINSAVFGDITSGGTSIPMNATTIEALRGIGSLTVTGSITGTANNPVVIAATGQATPDEAKKVDLAIGRLTVGGSVNFTNILAGYDAHGVTRNADAQIGTISIAGALNSSNIVAGAVRGDDGVFGTSDDVKISYGTESEDIISRIASISVGSITANAGQFGIVAEEIGSLKIGGVATALAKGKGNDLKTLETGTVLRELGVIPV